MDYKKSCIFVVRIAGDILVGCGLNLTIIKIVFFTEFLDVEIVTKFLRKYKNKYKSRRFADLACLYFRVNLSQPQHRTTFSPLFLFCQSL